MIKNISIIGLGLIGGSLAKSFKKFNANLNIKAFDFLHVIKKAILEKSIDEGLENVEDSLQSEVVFICLPITHSIEIFRTLLTKTDSNTIITDVCGVKNIFHQIWQTENPKALYVGGHPMTGKEKGGYENADYLLFENAVYILSEFNKQAIPDKFIQLLNNIGARIKFLAPDIHDEVVAKISHVPQLLSLLLMNYLPAESNQTRFFDFAGGGFRDMTRIAASKFDIWKDIIAFNKNQIVSGLNELKIHILEIADLISSERSEEINRIFENSNDRRCFIPENNKGFNNNLVDLFIYVKDEPGVIAKISSLLFFEGINIKDIELLKIREGQGGTFRLSFENMIVAQNALSHLKKINIESYLMN